MVTLERGTRRVGRSQAASIFWGLVSAFFAAAACYYFWKYHENESSANVLRDQVMTLQEQRETLNSQKDQMQSNISQTEADLKTREDFLQEKEAKLGLEQSRLETLGQKSDSQSEQGRSQAAVVKKFNDAVRKLVQGEDTDVVVRGGRPVLRVPSSTFFDFGTTTLKPEGKALLKQIAAALDGQMANFELRIETFTDSEGESGAAARAPAEDDATKKDDAAGPAPTATDGAAPAKATVNPGWALTGTRAGALARYVREQTSLPFQNVLIVPRADVQPIIPSGGEGHAKNRRVEITITPMPVAFHPTDAQMKNADVVSLAKPKAVTTTTVDLGTPPAGRKDKLVKPAAKKDEAAKASAKNVESSAPEDAAPVARKPKSSKGQLDLSP